MKLIIICVVIVSILYTVVNGQLPSTLTSTKLECKANGEYCQNHWDCCSYSCLSFSYRCVHSNNYRPTSFSSYFIPIQQNVTQPTIDIDELIERFGHIDVIKPTKTSVSNNFPTQKSPFQTVQKKQTIPPTIPFKQISIICSTVGQRCQYHSQCCSNSCLSYSYRCVASHQNLQTIYDKSPPYVVINEQANSNVISGINAIDELVDRFGNDEFITDQVPTVRPVLTMSPTTPTTITSTPKVHSIVCSNEGQRCFTTDDCCSNNNTCSEASVCVYNSRHEMLNEKCLTNGNKCFRHEECCSSRCHQFLHQCVT